ncbi:MAG: tRNA (adenosine(37)-N6)-threonylcarbamoyltransferase complex transferase subunit TsaD [Puniceicoccales bacterium]|jgi:N6-L-threonylcarbamoyladenine synthase|nr:tRNA (adenosine(37)-N6)-threonylcarbamoyltransferase complex transferase subunit TsaD [Puniceicoccales bacterium]
MILGVESSCDDTGLALWDGRKGQFLYEKTSSQIDLHADYGGVVPQLAAREHLRNFPLLLEDLMQHVDPSQITGIAVTCGPGLAGSLALGIAFAESLGLILHREVVGIHHLRGHILSSFMDRDPRERRFQMDNFPHLSLLVSGGNTILSELDADFNVRVLAETMDDAAGEAMDKGAKLLGLKYPGGPEIERFAASGNEKRFRFPQAFTGDGEMAFSFSGLKTSLRYMLEKLNDEDRCGQFSDICASYQFAVVDILARKMEQNLKRGNFKSVGLSGGVANNRQLRMRVQELGVKYGIHCYLPQPKYTGDNASMIAFAAGVDGRHTLKEIDFYPRWSLEGRDRKG